MHYVAELRWQFIAPRATVDIDLVIQQESLESLIGIATELGYTIRGKDLQAANGAIEIRRFSKIEPESGDLLSLDLLLGDSGNSSCLAISHYCQLGRR